MALPTDLKNRDPGHAGIHNATNAKVNELAAELEGRLSEGDLSTTFASFGTDLNAYVAALPAGALYTYTLLDAAGVLLDIYTGKKAA